jgi:hypothetical protein
MVFLPEMDSDPKTNRIEGASVFSRILPASLFCLPLPPGSCAWIGSYTPSLDVYGSYFPAWLICLMVGVILTIIVSLMVWPEDSSSIARQKLAACLRAIARLLNIRGGTKSNLEREGLELEIASHLAEANAYQEHAAFETLIHGPLASEGPDLETTSCSCSHEKNHQRNS